MASLRHGTRVRVADRLPIELITAHGPGRVRTRVQRGRRGWA
ncbi:hypothetical protein [Nonomuraea typhae]|nr:hypothetical protein [Nonomuraea typhae]